MLIVLLLFAFIIIALLDAPGLVRKGYWRELVVYSGLMLIALILSVLLVLEVPLPAVTTEIGKFVDRILGLGSASK